MLVAVLLKCLAARLAQVLDMPYPAFTCRALVPWPACRCPVCSAPKRRFKPYAGAPGRNDQKSMNARWEKLQKGEGLAAGGDKEDNSAFFIGGVAGAVLLAAVYFFLSAQYN